MARGRKRNDRAAAAKITDASQTIAINLKDPSERITETYHPGSFIEWWFVQGSFHGNRCGTRFFMASLFRYDQPEKGQPFPPGYYLIVSLLDPVTGRTEIISRGEKAILSGASPEDRGEGRTNLDPEVLGVYLDELRTGGPPPPITLEEELPSVTGVPFSVTWKDFLFAENGDNFSLAFDIPGSGCRCSLTLRPLSRRFEMQSIGATSRQSMAYATIPRLDLEGEYGGERITGNAWFDHQWGNACWFVTRPYGGKLTGWDWIGINGDDGSDWIFLVFYDRKSGRIISRTAILFEPGKDPRIIRHFSVKAEAHWESRRTHIRYPVHLILTVPELSARIAIRPVVEDQEIPVLGFMRAVWEGAAVASGTVGDRPFSGMARLELQGYGYIFDFRKHLQPYFDRIEECIGAFFPRTISDDHYQRLAGTAYWRHETVACNETIARPFWDLLSRRKKYWRPVFGMLMLESLGVDMERYRMLLSVVPEFTHTGTLIIDDIEDNATQRRGDACIHHRYGTDIAINAANTLYFLPSTLYGTHPHMTDGQRLEFYRITLDGYVSGHLGQALDIYWTKNLSEKNLAVWQKDHLKEKILQMYDFKTASTAVVMAEACCILAEADKKTRDACMDLARSFGVAFQIINDINDFDPEKAGDATGEDIATGKLTYVIVRAMEELDGSDRKRLEKIFCSTKMRRDSAIRAEAVDLIRKSGSMELCRKEAARMVEEGWNAFSHAIPPSEYKLMLRLFSRALIAEG
jgi:geranylgeranyl diphosphate synthase type I